MIQRQQGTKSPSLSNFVAMCQCVALLSAWIPAAISPAQQISDRLPRDASLAHETVTEIWMSGDDVVMSRRVRRDAESAASTNDATARSMLQMAAARSRAADEKQAEWLVEWARKISNGRIGADYVSFRDDNAAPSEPMSRSSRQPSDLSARSKVMTESQSPLDAAFETSPYMESAPIEPKPLWNSNSRHATDTDTNQHAARQTETDSPSDRWLERTLANPVELQPLERSVKRHVQGPRNGAGPLTELNPDPSSANSVATKTTRRGKPLGIATVPQPTTGAAAELARSEPPTGATFQPIAGGEQRSTSFGHQVVPLADMRSDNVPADADGNVVPQPRRSDQFREPTLVALLSFTSGFLFCAGLVALVALTPRSRSGRVVPESPVPVVPHTNADLATKSVQRENAGRPAAAPRIVPIQARAAERRSQEVPDNKVPDNKVPDNKAPDQAASMVEDFFNSNVELLKRCA